MLRARSPRESRIVGNPPVRFDEGEGSVRTLSTLLLVLEGPGHAWRILAHPVLVRIKALDPVS
jgi:hypothetical protein